MNDVSTSQRFGAMVYFVSGREPFEIAGEMSQFGQYLAEYWDEVSYVERLPDPGWWRCIPDPTIKSSEAA